MSQENVEITRRQHDAAVRGDWDAYEAVFDPDIVVRTDPSWPEQFIHGRQAVIDWLRSVQESLGTDRRIEDIMDLGDRVLIRWHWHMLGQRSGLEDDLRWSSITTYRDGRVVFIEMFRD